jgi:4a-hydroxytetrahydrobiopterin dehydratase
MAALDDETVLVRLGELSGWELRPAGESGGPTAIRRELTFKNFSEAFGFMTRVALIAEKLDHHPDWSNSWNRVDLAITNHNQGGVTETCLELARRVNALV